jgi:hypothetical protein
MMSILGAALVGRRRLCSIGSLLDARFASGLRYRLAKMRRLCRLQCRKASGVGRRVFPTAEDPGGGQKQPSGIARKNRQNRMDTRPAGDIDYEVPMRCPVGCPVGPSGGRFPVSLFQ